VYEEEVLEKANALYWSPDGKVLGFLSFYDQNVHNYTIPYYICKQNSPPSYPCDLTLRYPKAGYPNPIPRVGSVYVDEPDTISRLSGMGGLSDGDTVVGEFVWLTEGHDKYMVRSFNRIQTRDVYTIYHVGRGDPSSEMEGQERIQGLRDRTSTDGGWLDNEKTLHYAGTINGSESYLMIDDQDGWNHIYLYPCAKGLASTGVSNSSNSTQLTSGNWEIRKIKGVDIKNGMVYFTSSEMHPTESHPYSLNLTTGEKRALVNTKTGFWDMEVSPKAQYAVLSNHGPGVPYQELYALNDTSKPIRVIEDNAAFSKRIQEYALPKVEFLDLQHPDGYNLSAKIIYPVGFDKSKRYPVLMNPYGGPTSQEVKKEFSAPGFQTYIASDPDLEYVVFVVDNRGTGQRGRAFRQSYYKRMGDVDVADQLWSAHWLADAFPWVDREKIGVWGWSNGGYLAAKMVERGDPIISWAIATAPSTDQRLYDSIYTERYLGNPDDNADVYDQVAIRNATGFKTLRGSILIQHGTGDDNVHFQNSMVLVDMLMQNGVNPNKVQVQYFPDSEHSIHYGRDSEFLYKQITAKLFMEKNRIVPDKKRQWEVDDGENFQYWFQEDNNKRNVLFTSPTTQGKWRMMQGEEAIAT
jgi:dipeptidyl-peptidase 4